MQSRQLIDMIADQDPAALAHTFSTSKCTCAVLVGFSQLVRPVHVQLSVCIQPVELLTAFLYQDVPCEEKSPRNVDKNCTGTVRPALQSKI